MGRGGWYVRECARDEARRAVGVPLHRERRDGALGVNGEAERVAALADGATYVEAGPLPAPRADERRRFRREPALAGGNPSDPMELAAAA